jgi:hypothetical protein
MAKIANSKSRRGAIEAKEGRFMDKKKPRIILASIEASFNNEERIPFFT